MKRNKSGIARDSQRQKVYDSEYATPSPERKTVADCQAFVDLVIGSDWWKARHPSVRQITITDGRRRRSAAAFTWSRKIAAPRSGRNELTLLHEIAHFVTPERCAWHGPEFTRDLLALVDRFLPEEVGKRLRAQYRTRRVKVQRTSAGEKKLEAKLHEINRVRATLRTLEAEYQTLRAELRK